MPGRHSAMAPSSGMTKIGAYMVKDFWALLDFDFTRTGLGIRAEFVFPVGTGVVSGWISWHRLGSNITAAPGPGQAHLGSRALASPARITGWCFRSAVVWAGYSRHRNCFSHVVLFSHKVRLWMPDVRSHLGAKR